MYAIRSYYGLQAHLVVDADDRKALDERTVAVDLGETQMITAVFDDGKALLYSGRLIKAIRRYWQKVRRCVITSYSIHYTKLYDLKGMILNSISQLF